jgi:2-phosphoglycerate kinase
MRCDELPLGDPDGAPYSRGLMAQSLVAADVLVEPAYTIATRLERDLVMSGRRIVEPERFEEVAAEVLGEAHGKQVARRLRLRASLQELDLPIVLLVGGATGTGKSTVATAAAHRLGITRVTSTDFIRQTIRAFFPPDELPAVHVSSFEARGADGSAEEGFLEQSREVLVGVEASIERALTEGWSMAIEGVHLVPGLVSSEIEGALLVHAILRVDSLAAHRDHFLVRDATTGGVRPMARYLDQMTEIRLLQDSIVDRAERFGVPVIEGSSTEVATSELLELVLSRTEQLQSVG